MQLQFPFNLEEYDFRTHPLFPFLPCSKFPLFVGQNGHYLLEKEKRIVYVGRSKRVRQRLYSHKFDGKQFDTVRCVPYPSLERLFVRVMQPDLNRYLRKQ